MSCWNAKIHLGLKSGGSNTQEEMMKLIASGTNCYKDVLYGVQYIDGDKDDTLGSQFIIPLEEGFQKLAIPKNEQSAIEKECEEKKINLLGLADQMDVGHQAGTEEDGGIGDEEDAVTIKPDIS